MRRSELLRRAPALAKVLIVAAGLIGCTSEGEDPSEPVEPAAQERSMKDSPYWPKITLTSTAFSEGQPIPKKYTGEAADVSPPLSWSYLPSGWGGHPEGIKELALICDDPDAPGGTWVHWVVYSIPATATELPEDLGGSAGREAELAGVIEGKNSFGNTGYGGPMPPTGHGKHRYFFKLYALNSELDLPPDLDKPALEEAIKDHIVGKGELMGTYQR